MDKMEFEVLLYGTKVSVEEQARVVRLVEELLYYGNFAFREGILALEREMDNTLEMYKESNEEYFFLRDVIRKMCDALEPEVLEDIMKKKIVLAGTNTLKGYLYYIVEEWAMTLLHNILNEGRWNIVAEKMFLFVENSEKDRIEQNIMVRNRKKNAENQKQLLGMVNKICPKQTMNPFICIFDAKVAELSDRMIQKLIAGIETERKYIPTLLAFCNESVRKRIMNNMPMDSILDNVVDIINASDDKLTEILEYTLILLRLLECMGEP